ncbi:Uncharacterized protein TCM_038637 [Theobroma cacao]|uniref:Uncharacterized protein n=1 Tax=Theobroma cacao TaxID=3641 RepID=A0A061GX63_THECC|nr:Uncharacterized protein TCM_038637 [Theobroma cacao]
MTLICHRTTSRLNTLAQDIMSVVKRETVHTRASKHYEFKDILQALDNRKSHRETVINHKVWSNLKPIEDNVEQPGSNIDELHKGWYNMVDSLICHDVGLDELMAYKY